MTENLLPPKVTDYVTGLVPARHPELVAMEDYAAENNFPIIGPACGYLCYQIARLVGARQVFELGSGYGYSTAWFARAVVENGGGRVHHVVWDEELSRRARRHLGALAFDDVVEYHVDEAVATLRATPGPFDVIFNDIEKRDYPGALPVIKEKLRSGGVLIVDNMLWNGRIFSLDDASPDTEGIRQLTRELTGDSDWITTLVPIRDGLMVAYKK